MAALLQQARQTLESTSGSPALDAQLLLAHCLDWPRSRLFSYPEHNPETAQAKKFLDLIAQRSDKMPVAYLLGEQEFWSLPFHVNADCLVPRPETEDLVAWALEQKLGRGRVLDLGTGSGAIAIALAHERPHWSISASDASPAALQLARKNAARSNCDIEFKQSNWFQAIDTNDYDLILSNPPYLAQDDPHLPDLQHEPQQALIAEEQGMADLRHIAEQSPQFLVSGGLLAMEHGMSQGAQVRGLMQARGFEDVMTQPDLAGLERFTHGRWGHKST